MRKEGGRGGPETLLRNLRKISFGTVTYAAFPPLIGSRHRHSSIRPPEIAGACVGEAPLRLPSRDLAVLHGEEPRMQSLGEDGERPCALIQFVENTFRFVELGFVEPVRGLAK